METNPIVRNSRAGWSLAGLPPLLQEIRVCAVGRKEGKEQFHSLKGLPSGETMWILILGLREESSSPRGKHSTPLSTNHHRGCCAQLQGTGSLQTEV